MTAPKEPKVVLGAWVDKCRFLSGLSYGYRPRSVYRIGGSLTKPRFEAALLETEISARKMFTLQSVDYSLLSFADQENPDMLDYRKDA